MNRNKLNLILMKRTNTTEKATEITEQNRLNGKAILHRATKSSLDSRETSNMILGWRFSSVNISFFPYLYGCL